MTRIPLLAAVAGLSVSLLGSAPPRRAPLRRASSAIDDAAILSRFADLVAVDLDCAQLAATNGHSREVRDFAGILVREHGMARQLVRDIASQLHVTLKPSSSDGARRAEHEKVLAGLRERPDIAFDILFLRHEIDYHKDLLNLINTEWLPAVQNTDLSGLMSQVGPAFEAHNKMAEALWQQVAPKK